MTKNSKRVSVQSLPLQLSISHLSAKDAYNLYLANPELVNLQDVKTIINTQIDLNIKKIEAFDKEISELEIQIEDRWNNWSHNAQPMMGEFGEFELEDKEKAKIDIERKNEILRNIVSNLKPPLTNTPNTNLAKDNKIRLQINRYQRIIELYQKKLDLLNAGEYVENSISNNLKRGRSNRSSSGNSVSKQSIKARK